MGVNKQHHEFSVIDMNSGWETLPGYSECTQQKILSGALDEANKRGSRTRLLRFAPGAFTTKQVVHEYWEEVYIVSSDFTIGGKLLPPNSYTCQPPGVYHGPFKSNGGCLLFEVHYFDPVYVRSGVRRRHPVAR